MGFQYFSERCTTALIMVCHIGMSRQMMSETDKPESENDDFSGTRHAYAKSDETEMLHLLELVSEGDKLHINDRARTLDVTDVRDTESDRVMTLVGNGSRYTVVVERNRDGEPTHAVLKLGSSQELIKHVHVANRNAFMIPEYDRLMTEELETVAAGHHVECLKEHVERTGADWNDFPAHHRMGKWTLSGDALAAVKWAISAFVAEYREDGQMGQSDYSLDLFTTSLALWEQVRGQRDAWTFVGSEMDKLGAYLDYGVEDTDISERIPDDAVDALDALRNGEDVGDIGLSHPEGGEDRDSDGDSDDGGDGADTEDSGRRGYVSPDAAERNSEALDHREQRNRNRTVQNSRSLGDSQLATDGGATPRDVMVDCSPGDELAVYLSDGERENATVDEVHRSDANAVAKPEIIRVRVTIPPGHGHKIVADLDGSGPVNLVRTMFAGDAAEQGHIPEDKHSDPDTPVRVELGEVERIERLETDGGEWDPEQAELRDSGGGDQSAHARRNAEALRAAREELDDEDANPGGEPVADGAGEPMNVSADEWEDMTLRFDNPRDSVRVQDEPTSFRSLSTGDVVVLDVGKHTGPADWGQRRTTHFNKTAYRVSGRRELTPSDGRAAELQWKHADSPHAGAIWLWSEQRVSADAKVYRVLESGGDGDE